MQDPKAVIEALTDFSSDPQTLRDIAPSLTLRESNALVTALRAAGLDREAQLLHYSGIAAELGQLRKEVA